MRIGIIADVHCNHQALRIALERMGAVDELVCAGDAVYQYRFSNEVMEALRGRRARYVLGNHEEVLLGPWGETARNADGVRRENVDYMRAQPLQLDARVNGRRLIVLHGSPFDPRYEYLYPGDPKLSRMEELGADYVVLGHTHHHAAQRAGRTLVINPGSCGEARDYRNGFLLSYAVLDTETDQVTFDHFPDPTRAPVDPSLLPRQGGGARQSRTATPHNTPFWGAS